MDKKTETREDTSLRTAATSPAIMDLNVNFEMKKLRSSFLFHFQFLKRRFKCLNCNLKRPQTSMVSKENYT